MVFCLLFCHIYQYTLLTDEMKDAGCRAASAAIVLCACKRYSLYVQPPERCLRGHHQQATQLLTFVDCV
jgi:hypothetical protein